MGDLPVCSVEGCSSQVNKAGHTLCLKHWKAAQVSTTSPVAKEVAESPTKHSQMLSSTVLGDLVGVSSQRMNAILSELGWISRDRKGWIPTDHGKNLGAEKREHHMTGIPFVLWPENIQHSKILLGTVKEILGTQEIVEEPALEPEETGFRGKFKATHRSTDGHWVRSRAEMLVDNWLYMSGVVHAYERRLPIEEELYCDFYIPAGKVYLEFWGLENDVKYQARKEVKKDIYRRYGFNLIELTDEHIKNLDDHLPKLLLKFNVVVG